MGQVLDADHEKPVDGKLLPNVVYCLAKKASGIASTEMHCIASCHTSSMQAVQIYCTRISHVIF